MAIKTRSSYKNNSPESQGHVNSSQAPGELSPKSKMQDIPDSARQLTSEELKNCHKCQKHPDLDSLYLKTVIGDQDKNDWFWLCEDCYSTLHIQEQTLSFYRFPQNGGLFEHKYPASSISSQPPPQFCSEFNFHMLSQTILNLKEWLKSLKVPSLSNCEQCNCNYKQSIWKFIYFLPFFLLLVQIAIFVWPSPVSHQNLEPGKEHVEIKIMNSFHALEESFPHQNIDLWVNFASGFKNIAESDEISPAVFLILHSNETKTSFCIINQVCKIAHEHLNVSSRPLVLDAVQLHNKYFDQGDFILEMEKNMKSRKISVIMNLHMMPGKLAEGLHGLTDAYNPLVEKVIYLMSIPLNQTSYSESVFELAEDVLHQYWRDVHEEKLDPLLARLTTNVMWISDEKRFPEYC